ncbi:hypothetical protein ACFLQG_01360 [Candidatus Zixiibacteriota bacterium]
MKRFITKFFIWSVIILIISPLTQAVTEEPVVDTILQEAINVYIDCSNCDHDFLRREITFVNFVRDRNQADVHILVTNQLTGSGGNEYMIEFIGKKDFQNMADTLVFNTIESDTDDNVRNEMSKYFKLGLTRFVAKTVNSEHLSVSFTKPTTTSKVKDKWNNWVFEIETSISTNGEKSYRYISLWNEYEAARVTEASKLYFSLYWNYNEQKFSYDDVTLSISRSKGTNGDFVFSINDKWSYAFFYNFFTSTYGNKDFDYSSEIGLEYNIFPYKESSRRAWILRYNLGITYMDYTDITIYDKYNEWLTYSRFRSSVELTQPWGSVYWSLNSILYLHDFKKNRITFSGGMSVNLFEGFSVNFDGNYSRVRDQISLRRPADFTDEDVLLRQKELASGYNYWLSFGVSYSFGSIYNNIVNPRF